MRQCANWLCYHSAQLIDTLAHWHIGKLSNYLSILKVCRLHIDTIFLNHSRIPFFGTGQITETCERLLFIQIDNQLMRIGHIIHCHPESRFLKIENFIGRTISTAGFFTVGIPDFPMLAGNRFTIITQDIELCNSDYIIPGLWRKK